MNKRLVQAVLIVAALVIIGGVVVARALIIGPAVTQPIAFNHKLHTQKVGLACNNCHTLYETQAASGRPSIDTCMMCHIAVQKEGSLEEEKIRQFKADGQDIPWERIYVAPDNVFYSHRRHVVVAGIDCDTCHGPMGEQEKPPRRPLKKIRMEICIDCHVQRGASTDCLSCHR